MRPPLHGLLLLWALLAAAIHALWRLPLWPPAPSLERLTLLGHLLPAGLLQSRLLFDGLRLLFLASALLWLARRLLPASAWVATLAFAGAVSMSIESSPYTEHHHQTVAVLLGVQALWFTTSAAAMREADRDGVFHRRPLEPAWVPFVALYYVAVTHTLAGLSKLRESGLGWANGLSLQLWVHEELATRGETPGLLARLVLEDRRLAAGLQGAALLVETLAVLACLGGRLRRALGLGLVGLHLGIELLFGFGFHGTLAAVVLLMLVRPETETGPGRT